MNGNYLIKMKSLIGWLFSSRDFDIEERGRRRLLTVFIAVLVIPLIYFGISHTRAGIINYGITNLILAVVFLIFIFALRKMKNGLPMYRITAFVIWWLLFFWVYTGAFEGYASIWVIAYPPVVFFLMGKIEGAFWTAAMLIMCLAIFINPGGGIAHFEYSGIFVQRHMGTMLVIILFTYNYESVRQKFKKAMESEQVELYRHKEHLEEIVDERTKELKIKNNELVSALEERRKMQIRLSQAQKMESLGTLVGGIAHDFNNLLGGITGSLNMIQIINEARQADTSDEIKKYTDIALEASERSSGMIKRLLTLSREHELILVPLDLNVPVNNILEICKNSLPKSVVLDFHTFDYPLTVMADPVQIEQVILNLCINASQAMTLMRKDNESEGGVLAVKTYSAGNKDIPSEFKDEAEKWVRIDVSDTGVGIDDDIVMKIFDPFYTTKSSGEGTGLGLSISYGIVKQHGGYITVNSTPGSGSLFSIFLPSVEEKPKNEQREAGAVESYPQDRGGRILIVDDEKFILKTASGILENSGLDVITAESSMEALDLYAAQFNSISAVILDLSMPGMSGLDLFEKLKKINPDVKAVLSSGMLDNEVRDAALKKGIVDTIYKPYSADMLVRVMKSII